MTPLFSLTICRGFMRQFRSTLFTNLREYRWFVCVQMFTRFPIARRSRYVFTNQWHRSTRSDNRHRRAIHQLWVNMLFNFRNILSFKNSNLVQELIVRPRFIIIFFCFTFLNLKRMPSGLRKERFNRRVCGHWRMRKRWRGLQYRHTSVL